MTDTGYTDEELDMFEHFALEAEQGYDVDDLRRRGRPKLGPAAYSVVVPIRLTEELTAALDARAAAAGQSRSEAVRDLLQRELLAA
ncbi:MAG: ribbon-helix-helix protein, CopG family [Propionibacteriaceae bacterium]|nr:ribbon-helix-helix protein, CopG family [Propionibacteriaceae bacterium]